MKEHTLRRWPRRLSAWLIHHPWQALLNLACAAFVFWLASGAWTWLVSSAIWHGDDPSLCQAEGAGACWIFVRAQAELWIFGFFPATQRWRVLVALLLVLISLCLLRPRRIFMGQGSPLRLAILSVGLLLILSELLVGGHVWERVDPASWSGMVLSFIVASVALGLALPGGLALALARRSSWPLFRVAARIFIELWRGVPLITVLFMASVVLPLCLPPGMVLGKLPRALLAMAAFTAAYIAEVLRGGLDGVDAGQTEAAAALGLSPAARLRHIILPQAIAKVRPSLAAHCASLFKDTTLIATIGLLDFLGMIQATSSQPAWLGHALEGYICAALFYWLACFWMTNWGRGDRRQG